MILLNADYISYILFEISLGFSRNIRRFLFLAIVSNRISRVPDVIF